MNTDSVRTVSEITQYIKGALEFDEQLQDVLVRGEISNYRNPSKHLYFSLKDSGGLLSCVMFAGKLQNVRFELENGLEVVARGSIGVYPPQGRYQLYVDELLPVGRGLLYLQYEKLKGELAAAGYFAAERKRRLPLLPLRIGIATSLKGAAVRDILRILAERFKNLDIVLTPCLVQGKTAARDIADAIERLNRYGELDVIIVGRGGGSFEDLFAFNEREVANAILSSNIPVLAAVGHEIDQTIADLTADASAPTPTAAAQSVVPRKEELLGQLQDHRLGLQGALQTQLQLLARDTTKQRRLIEAHHPRRVMRELRQRVDELRRRMHSCLNSLLLQERAALERTDAGIARSSPEGMVREYRQTVEAERGRLGQALAHSVQQMAAALNHSRKRLLAVSPYAVLKRGYSIVTSEKGEIVRKYSQTKKNSTVTVTLYQGKLYAYIYKLQERHS